MIKTITNPNNIEITLTPNRSLSANQTQWVILGVCSFVFLIALFWSAQGAFLVLPFAGLDIILFAITMFKINKETSRKQMITIDSSNVLIQSGFTDIEDTVQFPLIDTFVRINQNNNLINLTLCHSHSSAKAGEEIVVDKTSVDKRLVEIGSFLNQNDKNELRKVLNASGLPEVNEHWWKLQQ